MRTNILIAILASNILYSSVYAGNQVTYYISPTGSDSNSGTDISNPLKSFKYAFSVIERGSKLILLKGNYSVEAGTGILREEGSYGENIPGGSVIPNGLSKLEPTIIEGIKFGEVFIHGYNKIHKSRGTPLSLGSKTFKAKHIHIKGIIFEGGGQLYNTDNIVISDSGFHGFFGIGSSDHYEGNTNNLIQDVFIYTAENRSIASNYRSHFNIWRRVLIRGDGCTEKACGTQSGSGFTVYDSHDVSVQNMIVVDRILRNAVGYADFSTAQHTDENASFLPKNVNGKDFLLGRNEWLGCMSLNSKDESLIFEADGVISGDLTAKVKNFVSINSVSGINIPNKPYNYDGSSYNKIENNTIYLSASQKNHGMYIDGGNTNNTIRNMFILNSKKVGIYAPAKSRIHDIYTSPISGTILDKYSRCINNCKKISKKEALQSFKYPVRLEKNSSLHTKNIGATVLFQYGNNNSKYDEEYYNKLSKEKLWPWRNEQVIFKEMCKNTSRGFCGYKPINKKYNKSITAYIWEMLGNAIPDNMYE